MAQSPESLLPRAFAEEMRPENIGTRLYMLRTAYGLSPSEISDMLGIERTYWSRFEGGRRPVTETVAALLVARFGITLDWLILGKWDKLPLDLAERLRTIPPKE